MQGKHEKMRLKSRILNKFFNNQHPGLHGAGLQGAGLQTVSG